ncbi:hypothetical protein Aperf_G00000090550 [Anoplocephala perfoliata]
MPHSSRSEFGVNIPIAGINGVVHVPRALIFGEKRIKVEVEAHSPSGIKIQLKPLVLASDNEKFRNQDIDFIESAGFVQTSFRSSRRNDTAFKSPAEVSDGGLNAVRGTSGEYEALVRERAHEAAIFGTGRGRPLGALPSDETGVGYGQTIVPTTQVVKEIIHPSLKKDKVTAYREWASRLNDLANARRQIRQSASGK